ncbi:MAG TPA: hypothetical protein VJ577_05710 [Burkholderiaceae bacterium]|nr:hypothetical protein [Burkholderiaceae bacterium]
MMQINEIQQRFSNVERTINQVTQACETGSNMPQDLKDCVQKLDQETGRTKQVLQSQDQKRIVECVDNLEQLSDRTEQAVERASNLDANIRNAVMQAHRELSTLKHQLH